MNADDDAGMAYFLPNGIADDSPPKPTRFAAPGFGPIGTPSSAASSSFFGSGRTSGGSSPAVQEFAPPSLLRPTGLDRSPFRSTSSPSPDSPRQQYGNYLLSDLGGEIHDPGRGSSSSLGFNDRATTGDASATPAAVSRAGFGFPGSLRSPSSRMFDRGDPFTRPRNLTGTPRSIQRDSDDQLQPTRSSSSSFDMGTVVTSTGLLFAKDGSPATSELSVSAAPFVAQTAEDPFFSSAPLRSWPSHTASNAQEPRKVLSTPPGLSPPGLGRRDSPLSQLAAPSDSTAAFKAFESSTIGSTIGAFGTAEARPLGGSSGRIGAHLSRLNLSADSFGLASPPQRQDEPLLRDGVFNPDLAELNTQSVKMDDVPSDSSPTRSPWQDTSSARRIEVQAKPKSAQNNQQSRPETGQESRGGSPLPLTSSSSADSPLRVVTAVDSWPAATSPSPSQGSSSSDVAAPSGDAQSMDASSSNKGRRRHAGGGATPSSSSYALAVGGAAVAGAASSAGNDSRKKAQGVEASSSADTSDLLASKSAKAKRKEGVGDTKTAGKAQASKKTTVRGVADKSAVVAASAATATAAVSTTSRRQAYREKQRSSGKDAEKTALEGGGLSGGPSGGSPGVKLFPAKETVKAPAEDVKPDAKSRRRRQRDAKELKQSGSMPPSKPSTGVAEEVVAASVASDAGAKKSTESAANTESKSTSFADVVASSKKPQKAAKKDSGSEKPQTTTVTTTSTKTKSNESEAAIKAATGQSASESLETRSTPTTEPTESKEDASTTVPDQREDDAETEAVGEREAVSNDDSSSDMDKAQLSTDDEFEVVPRHQEDATTSADESSASIPTTTHSASSREAKRADKAAKKAATKEKEQRKERQKKDKPDRKKSTKSRKDKRSPPTASSSSNTDAVLADDLLAGLPIELSTLPSPSVSTRVLTGVKKAVVWTTSAVVAAVVAALALWKQFAERAKLKGGLSTAVAHVESVLAVVLSVVLLLALHGASWFIRVHRVAFRALLSHRHIGFCFAFLYGFPALVHHIFPWAPPWAPVCLWYAFLVQLFCTNGPTAMMTTFRIILPLVFLVEGISHHSFLLDLNGAELLLTSFILSALKTSNLCSPIFFLSLAAQCLLAVFLGSEILVQWVQLAVALYSLHLMASTDEWIGFGDDDDDLAYHHQQQQPAAGHHHSIADYNHHPAPSSAVSIQKAKRLDRRALAYVRGRKMR